MSLLTEPTWIPKEKSPKQAVRYQSRIIHQVDPIQRELSNTLKALEQTTRDFIDYIPLGKLGVTLASLDPVLKQILGVNKKGTISESTRRDFEEELNTNLSSLGSKTISLEDTQLPLGMYGRSRDRLGLRLSIDDERLFGERVLVERYIRGEYPTVSDRFGDEIVNWEPHVTIGRVKPGSLSSLETENLYDRPSEFILDKATATARQNEVRFAVENISGQIIFPDELSLGGLRVVCDQQAERAF